MDATAAYAPPDFGMQFGQSAPRDEINRFGRAFSARRSEGQGLASSDTSTRGRSARFRRQQRRSSRHFVRCGLRRPSELSSPSVLQAWRQNGLMILSSKLSPMSASDARNSEADPFDCKTRRADRNLPQAVGHALKCGAPCRVSRHSLD